MNIDPESKDAALLVAALVVLTAALLIVLSVYIITV